MKFFTGKGVVKKLIITILAITLFSAIILPKVSYADTTVESVGGSLLSPVASLMIGIGDALMNLIHDLVYDMDTANLVISTKTSGWEILLSIVIGVVAAALIAVLAYYTAGAGLAILAKLGVTAGTALGIGAIGTIVKISLIGGTIIGGLTALSWFGDNVVFPMYRVTPEEIFKGEVTMLDINFFRDPEEVNDRRDEESVLEAQSHVIFYDGAIGINSIVEGKQYINAKIIEYGFDGPLGFMFSEQLYVQEADWIEELEWEKDGKKYQAILHTLSNYNQDAYEEQDQIIYEYTYTLYIKEDGVDVLPQPVKLNVKNIYHVAEEYIPANPLEETNFSKLTEEALFGFPTEEEGVYVLVKYYDTPENLQKITNRILNKQLKSRDYTGELDVFSIGNQQESVTKFTWKVESGLKYKAVLSIGSATDDSFTLYSLDVYKWGNLSLGLTLRPTVAKWYYAIRNFVLVAMMVILLYIGIRIIISGIASEKAKYKNMLIDWVVAIFLVFVMQYIMSFSMNIVDGITDIFSTIGNAEESYINVYELDRKLRNKLRDELTEPEKFAMSSTTFENQILKDENGNEYVTEDNKVLFEWNAGNMLGIIRIQAGLCESGNVTYIGFAVAYVVLVLYTFFFLFTYIRRALYLAFFTIIAPLVAMTYPIDKIHDGKAQAFNMWLREYIFNLMIQPIHLLLYTILLRSAWELSSNVIYTLVAIGFMMPAEKFLRKMFGFDKAQTPGFLGGAAGAALAVTGMNKIFNRKSGKGGGSNGGHYDDDKSKNKNSVKLHTEKDPGLLANIAGSGASANSVANGQNKARRARNVRIGNYASNSAKSGGKSSISVGSGTRLRMSSSGVSDANDASKEKIGFLRKHLRAIGNASKSYTNAKLTRAAKNIKSGKPIRDLAQFAGGAYLGLGGALIGATMGIASGDLKNVGQYGAALGAAGYAVGSRTPAPDRDIEEAYEEYKKSLADSPEEYELEQQRRKIIENENNLRNIRDALKLHSLREAQDIMEEYGDCIDAGIMDMDDLATIISLDQAGQMDKDMGTVAAKYYKKAGGKPKNMAPDSKELKHIKHICENIARSNGLSNQADIDASVKTMLSNLDLYGSYKDKLTEV